MAGDWLKVEKETLRKPEVLKLAASLSIHPDHALGVVLRFWAWADGVSSDGRLPGITAKAIDDSLGYAGFTSTMLSLGWLREAEHGFSIPRFERHMGACAKKRLADLERQQRKRERDKRDTERDENVTLSFSSEEKIGEEKTPEEEKPKEAEVRHTLSEGPERAELWPQWLAREWLHFFGGTQRSERDLSRLDGFFRALIDAGAKPDAIRDRIRAPGRPRHEPTWEFAKHFGKAAGGRESVEEMIQRLRVKA